MRFKHLVLCGTPTSSISPYAGTIVTCTYFLCDIGAQKRRVVV